MDKILVSNVAPDDFILKRVSRDAVIVYKKNSTFWMTLNNTGYRIFDMILKGYNASQIKCELVEMYQVPEEYIANDYENFIKKLNERLLCAEDIKRMEDNSQDIHKLSKSVTIHITNKCNLNCPYCYKDDNSNLVELSKATILKVIDEAYAIGFIEFIFSGGEPTIRLELFEILETVKSNYPETKLGLITNGTTDIADENIDIMVQTLNAVQISIDSSVEEINSKTRGVGSVDKIKRLCNKLTQRGYKSFYFACVPYTSGMGEYANAKGVPQLLRLAAYMGAKGLYINMLKPNGRMLLEEYSKYSIQEFWESVDSCNDELTNLYNIGYRELSLFAAGDFKHILVGHQHKESCGAGVTELSIDNDGNVYPCPSLMMPEFLLGNLRDTSIIKIYDIAFQLFRDITVDHVEGCKDCAARYICGGGCRAVAYILKKDICAQDPFCEQSKKRIELWQQISLRLSQKLENNG